MEVTDCLQSWKSIRRYKPDPIPDQKLHLVLEAARRAPSWSNLQPWHFIVVKDEDIKGKLSALSLGQRLIRQAPVVIVCCGNLEAVGKTAHREALKGLVAAGAIKVPVDMMDKAVIENPILGPSVMEPAIVLGILLENLAIAYTFMAVEASNQGLGSCMIGGFGNPLNKQMTDLYNDLSKALGLTENLLLLRMLTLGFPDESPQLRPRKNLRDIASLEKFQNKFA
ncbi:MAG: nitroreductase family protein [Candidatus Tectomicrobia bacterium]|uniref:Nitroreductase family protein n=1 Tax=Tectimicrobiota bacterium TaxID=2528274 RepID=A0A933GJL9_UNCTE|nr:nitroreductase family protein [Candidatus Tectomicrobia bacterium]